MACITIYGRISTCTIPYRGVKFTLMVQVWSGFTPILTHQNMAINLLWYSLQPYNSHTHIAFFPHKHAGHIFLEPSLIILLACEGLKPHTCHYPLSLNPSSAHEGPKPHIIEPAHEGLKPHLLLNPLLAC